MDEMNKLCENLLTELDKVNEANNTVPYHEFLHYLPLFQKGGSEKMEEDEYKRLCEEWQSRVSLFDKVVIIDPHYSGEDKVLFELPALFQRLNEVNVVNDKAARSIDYFSDTLVRDTRFNGEMIKSLKIVSAVVDAAQLKSLDKISESVKEYIELRDKIENSSEESESTTLEENTSIDEFEWE